MRLIVSAPCIPYQLTNNSGCMQGESRKKNTVIPVPDQESKELQKNERRLEEML